MVSLIVVTALFGVAAADELLSNSGQQQCYTAGDITGAVVGTLLVTLALIGLGYAIYRMYWRGRRGKHLVLVTDPERGVEDDYAFDNPCFRDGTPIGRGGYEKEPVKSDQKNRWSAWSPIGALVGSRPEKRKALDDSFTGEPQVNVVSLRSHDFTGLGFNVCGNMRDGIFVKDVLHRGPASESGRITPGDRIDSIRISFRHMVFEDALTILSYASPYEVQLEVENPSPSSRPSTLIRTKRSSIEPADRICHPFYRSQSIADLAQIGKSSLKKVTDMGGSKSPRNKNELWDESRIGDYPTLKISPTPTKETIKLEKTSSPSSPAATAIVKPERVRRTPPKGNNPEINQTNPTDKDVKPDSLAKHQKFGIRVLPDPKAVTHLKSTSEALKLGPVTNRPTSEVNVTSGDKDSKTSNVQEAVRLENERNSMVEQIGGVPPSKKVVSEDVVDTAVYDERGIDVGPVEEEENRRKASLGNDSGNKDDEASKKTHDATDGHSNVKLLLTKGLQNLKEKLHHHDKKRTSTSPEPQVNDNPDPSHAKKLVSVKGVKPKRSADSSDSEGTLEKFEPSKVVVVKDVVESMETGKEENPNEGKIPTEIPEEVRRAALAARNNRRSSGFIPPETQVLNIGQEVPPVESNFPTVKYRIRQQESLSEDSSGDDLGAGTSGSNDTDSIGRAPKRSHKRKAPTPPSKDKEPSGNRKSVEGHIKGSSDIVMHTPDNITEDQNIQTMEVHLETDKHPTFANISRQQNDPPSNNEITNITVESSSPIKRDNPEVDHAQVNDDLRIIVDNPLGKTSDLESDIDKEDILKKRNKKGGTTIELNSSHITIHHSPSSDTVTLELEGDSTRKAASMGDLSRLDNEQHMSTLERAVSLDLADGNTAHNTHSSKKRKAPLPPAGDDYINTVQDSDDSGLYRKEPRLDNALDTFQRRRLKKSSDWGTMEDAMQQGSPPSPRKSLTSPTNILVGAMDNEPTSLTISVGEDDSEVFLESSPHQMTGIPVASARSALDPAAMWNRFTPSDEDIQYASITLTDVKGIEDKAGSQRTVLNISPEQNSNADRAPTSHMVFGQGSSSSGPSSLLTEEISRVTTSDRDAEVNGSRLLSFIQAEVQNNVESVEADTSITSSYNHTLVSSTPISKRDLSYLRNQIESLQSPQVTSTDPGVRNINVVSSTSPNQDLVTSPSALISDINDSTLDDDSIVSVTSTSEPFVTAASIVDSTTIVSTSDDDDATWGLDSQPPELPTSPVPVLTSNYNPSTSMTYITEIQVTTMNAKPTVPTPEMHNGSSEENKATVNSNVSPDSISSDHEENEPLSGNFKAQNGGADQKRNNVTVTAIKNSPGNSRIPTRVGNDVVMTTFQSSPNAGSFERSQIPLRIGTDGLLTTFQSHVINPEPSLIPMRISDGVLTSFQNNASNAEKSHIPMRIASPSSQENAPVGNNGISEKKSKAVRPPVPPRKSDSSLSSITSGDLQNSNHATDTSQNSSPGSSNSYINYGSNTTKGASKKFISFSSLTPRMNSGDVSGRNSSFEQWVFLEDSQDATANGNGNTHNGQGPSVVPVTSSVTHIVLDSKQSSGKRDSP